jgi:hypothetical protein
MVELLCPTSAFDRLTKAVGKTKTGTESIRVRVEDLQALMIDHMRLLRATPHKEPAE